MHTELEAVFHEHASPTHASKRDVHDRLLDVGQLAANVQKQIIHYEMLLAAAAHSPHDPAYDWKLELMRQTLRALRRTADQLPDVFHDLGQQMAQLDMHVREWRTGIEGIEREKAGKAESQASQ